MTYSVQLYDQVTDQKLEIIHINNTIDLDDNNDNFTELFEQELLDPKLKELYKRYDFLMDCDYYVQAKSIQMEIRELELLREESYTN